MSTADKVAEVAQLAWSYSSDGNLDNGLAILGLAMALTFKMQYPQASRGQFERVVGSCLIEVEGIIAKHVDLQDIVADHQFKIRQEPKRRS